MKKMTSDDGAITLLWFRCWRTKLGVGALGRAS